MKVEHLIFDMDDTLYPGTGKMNAGITQRMMENVADFYNCSIEDAILRRKENIADYSTTLEWLMAEGLTDVEGFFSHMHPENEAEELDEDPNLRPFLESIKIPKILLTNAPSEHAEHVLNKLNVRDQFDFICDIRYSGFKGKPYPSAFKNALKACGGTVENTIFLDDMIKYTDGFMALGGTAVQVGPKPGHHLSADSAAVCKETPPHPGRTFHIDTIYGLKDLLDRLESE